MPDFKDIARVEIAPSKKNKYSDDLHFEKFLTIGGGGNSGFQAINFSLQFGARKIVLIGFDMDDAAGKHWYGRNHWPRANNPDRSNFRRWIAAFDRAAPIIKGMGASVINCSPNSALKTFPIHTTEDALRIHGAGAVDMAGV